MIDGNVISIERCSLHDGPGLRTTVFLKGCPLSCLWCHNPESQSFKPELYTLDERCVLCGLCGTVCKNHVFSLNNDETDGVIKPEHFIDRDSCNACGNCTVICPHSALEIKGALMSSRDVIDVVMKDVRYYEQSGGGLTLSGGEPLSQFEFSSELLRMAKENNLHTCIETSGFAPVEKILSVLPHLDLVLYDYKESDNVKHKKFTGVSNELILGNLYAIDKAGANIILRCPIIPGYNAGENHFEAIAETASKLKNIIEVNVMPYHPMGASKAKRIGRVSEISDTGFPTDEQVSEWIARIEKKTNVPVKKG